MKATDPKTSSPRRNPTPPRGYLAVIRTIDKFTTVASYVFVLAIIFIKFRPQGLLSAKGV